jgi:cell wall-associated NlpC family hydrolase
MTPQDFSPQVNVIVANALTWAHARLSETRYATWCLSFVEDAFERSNSIQVDGYATAKEAADGYGARDDGSTPPAGALVFYDWWGAINGVEQNWGHVGLSLGDGRIIHALAEVRIDDIADVATLLPPNEAHPSRYIGWAPTEVVLVGSEPKVWDTGRKAQAPCGWRSALGVEGHARQHDVHRPLRPRHQ